MTIPDWCPICKLSDPQYYWRRITTHLLYDCYCPRCGQFISALHILNNEDQPNPEPDFHLLSGIVRELNERGEKPPEVVSNTIQKLLSHPLIPKTYKEQAMKLLPIISKRTKAYGKSVSFDLKYDLSLAYARDAEEFRSLIGYLQEEGLVKTPGKIFFDVDTNSEKQEVTLTTKGYDYLERPEQNELNSLSVGNAALLKAITSLNKVYRSVNGEDCVKLTNANLTLLSELPDEIKSKDNLRIFIEDFYKLFYEGTGELKRLPSQSRERFIFIKHLRTYWVHDLEHGHDESSKSKHKTIGNLFKKFSGKSSPELFEKDDYPQMAKNIILELTFAIEEAKKLISLMPISIEEKQSSVLTKNKSQDIKKDSLKRTSVLYERFIKAFDFKRIRNEGLRFLFAVIATGVIMIPVIFLAFKIMFWLEPIIWTWSKPYRDQMNELMWQELTSDPEYKRLVRPSSTEHR